MAYHSYDHDVKNIGFLPDALYKDVIDAANPRRCNVRKFVLQNSKLSPSDKLIIWKQHSSDTSVEGPKAINSLLRVFASLRVDPNAFQVVYRTNPSNMVNCIMIKEADLFHEFKTHMSRATELKNTFIIDKVINFLAQFGDIHIFNTTNNGNSKHIQYAFHSISELNEYLCSHPDQAEMIANNMETQHNIAFKKTNNLEFDHLKAMTVEGNSLTTLAADNKPKIECGQQQSSTVNNHVICFGVGLFDTNSNICPEFKIDEFEKYTTWRNDDAFEAYAKKTLKDDAMQQHGVTEARYDAVVAHAMSLRSSPLNAYYIAYEGTAPNFNGHRIEDVFKTEQMIQFASNAPFPV